MRDAILVVEDDPSAREMMVQLLHIEGFAPITAPNGREALHFLRAGGPAKVILLDLMMPVMDGWSFRRELRADPRLCHIPVAIVSGGTLRSVAELGVDAVLRKPIDTEEVVRVVRELCRPRSTGA